MKRAFYAPTVHSAAVSIARLGSCPSMPASASLRGLGAMQTPPITACRRRSFLACQPFKLRSGSGLYCARWTGRCLYVGRVKLLPHAHGCARRHYVPKTTKSFAIERITIAEEAAERLLLKAVDFCLQSRFDSTAWSSCQ